MIVSTLSRYLTLFIWSFLAATVLPLSSELALVALVSSDDRLVVPVIVATAGNYLGACTTYWLGRRARHLLEPHIAVQPQRERAVKLLRRWGQPALVLSWVPLLGDALVVVAGSLAVPFGAFSLWVVIGKAVRYLVVAWATYAWGTR
ncbi:MAG: DedA family protein [Chloroflexota bacterium]|nr:DedA family protein [Chloroflexota bacterium]